MNFFRYFQRVATFETLLTTLVVLDQLWTMQYRAFHFSLPQYLIKELERDIQKKAMSIICPGVSYHEALVIMNLRN